MEDVVELVVEPGEHVVVGDRALDELDARIVGHVLALRREQVVDDDDARGAARRAARRTRFAPTKPAPPTTRTVVAVAFTRARSLRLGQLQVRERLRRSPYSR